MTEQQTPDREQKIAEIREGLTFIVGEQSAGKWMGRCRFLLSELERLEREYAEERAAHNAHVTELCEKEEECRKLRKELDLLQELAVKVTVEREKERKSAQQEIERLREGNEGRKKIIEAYMRIEHDLAEEAERYLQQRDKLIECLRFYERLARGREVNDGGRRARTILAEIGVTVE